jgi:fructose-1,6-bisphosphatase/inositol monophosphatase family enzyme
MLKPAHTKNTTNSSMENSPILFPGEKEEVSKIRRIGNSALKKAFEAVRNLGASGIEEFRKNQYGDVALRGDIEAETAILNVLKESKLQIKVLSEEHGTTVIGNNALYLGILDGVDGSGVYKKDRLGGRYGTMFAVYKGTDPTYDDYLYGGIMEHVSGKLYFASKGEESWIIENERKKRLRCSGAVRLDNRSRLYADTNFDEVYEVCVVSTFIRHLKNCDLKCMRSSAIHYADLSAGNVDGVIEATRKGNLEIAVAFPLIREAGGVIFDVNGQSLGDKKYNEFGQKDHLIVISAATSSLANDILSKANG